ncbi:hypothetical protein IIQ44_20260 [Acinetobacter oleivorans]|uniref:hypothetical protein n=1 Tax=Acinetobacter TaxID=469 RepID=UPI000EC18D06|nr:hypothetical protein [Acinetobacter oleivorans]MBE2174224.1 hypothetical protein [Acinetobacter oleivorans]HCU74632.1 hypothetical protein [Acinetobacter baumannii]
MFEKKRIQNQDEWKRTQIRIPQDQYDAIVEYAEKNNLSLNTAMLDLMEKGFIAEGYVSDLSKLSNQRKVLELALRKFLPHTHTQNAAFHEQDNYLAVRGSHGNTTQNCSYLLDYINMPECIQVLLFATKKTPEPGFSRDDGPETNLPLMGAILLVELQEFNAYVIFDGLFLTAQRYPRYREVQEILDAAVSSDKAYFINISVPFTASWGPVGAVDQLLPLPREKLTSDSRKNFFKLLCNISEEKYLDMYRS